MKFEEREFIDLTDTPMVFVYFLIYKNEVIYVGQTTRGLARVYNHIKTKPFHNIYVIECDPEELDYWEDYYIFKYRPIYNKQPNLRCNFSIEKLKQQLKTLYPDGNITKRTIKKMLKELKAVSREYDGEYYVGIDTYYELVGCIDDYAKGAPLSEVFNIGI